MSEPAMVVRNISDTARWAAVFRANETLRADALFRDPYAARLAGALGVDIANTLPEGNSYAWAWVARTYLFDQFILREIQRGTDMVINLAAGLDARPCRMQLPPALQWVEIDLPEILAYKEGILASEKPTCRLERIRLDLSDVEVRKPVFAELAGRARKIVVLTEGLLIYLEPSQVIGLAKDLARHPQIQRWILDIHSPGLLRMMQRSTGKQLSQVGAPFKFGPAEGPQFLEPYGWRPVEVQGLLKTAARFKRPPFALRLVSLLPEKKGPQGSRPWSGVCLFEAIDNQRQ
jgi:methyltransferase (TIGR00027 family)